MVATMLIQLKGIKKMTRPYLELYDKTTNKAFKKYFDTEFDRDKFARKLKYSSKLQVIRKGDE